VLHLTTGVIDLDRGHITRDGRKVALTDKEVALLRYLAQQSQPVSQDQLLSEVWRYSSSVVSRTVRVTVGRLRKKIERDPSEPEHLVTVYGEGYRLVLPERREMGAVPAEVDRFVGRGELLADLERELDTGRRLITLVGPAGIGKTRLAHHFARTRAGGRAPWFCELASARTAGELTAIVASTLGLEPTADPVEQVGRALRGRGPVLLVLDNLEQVVEHAPDTVSRWLRMAGTTQVLATSRQPLRLRGEQVARVPPLPPSDAVDLLVERAGSLGVALDRAAAERLAVAVDGLPLALELVASQLIEQPVSAVEQSLSQRLVALRTTLRDAEPRHLSLQAALDTSWERLSEEAREGLSDCAVFRGGFTREAAAAVLSSDVLDELAERSLVRSLGGRFDLFVAVRQYAAERAPTGVANRHAAYYATLQPGSPADAEALTTLRAESRNLVAALEHRPAASTVLALAAAQDGLVPGLETAAWTQRVLDGPLTETERQRVTCAHGNALRLAGRFEEADAALAAASATDDVAWRGRALMTRGLLYAERAEPRAVALLTEAVADLRAVGDLARVGRALGPLGIAHLRRRELPEALAALEQGLEVTEATGDGSGQCGTLANLCTVLRESGRVDEAAERGEQAVALLDALDSRRKQGMTLLATSQAVDARGGYDRARELVERAVEAFRELGSVQYEGIALGQLGMMLVRAGDLDSARRLLGQALALVREAGDRNHEAVILGNLGNCNLDLGKLDEARDALTAAIEMHRERGNSRAEGHFLGVLAEVEGKAGDTPSALVALDDGERLLRATGDLHVLANLLVRRAQLTPGGDPAAVREARELVDQAGIRPEAPLSVALRALEG
jgi:predicted ATPase